MKGVLLWQNKNVLPTSKLEEQDKEGLQSLTIVSTLSVEIDSFLYLFETFLVFMSLTDTIQSFPLV